MSPFLKTFRVYCYDAQMMTISSDEIEAASDAEAIAIAQSRDFGSKCEIWDGHRLVAKLGDEPHPASAPPAQAGQSSVFSSWSKTEIGA